MKLLLLSTFLVSFHEAPTHASENYRIPRRGGRGSMLRGEPERRLDGRLCFESDGNALRSAAKDYMINGIDSISIDKYGPFEDWCVDFVFDFSSVFEGVETRGREVAPFNEDLSQWNVSSATTMYRMFFRAKNFNNLGESLASWDVSRVEDFGGMFFAAEEFVGLGLASWDVSSGSRMNRMFEIAMSFNSGGEV